jgi:hypothetical protein
MASRKYIEVITPAGAYVLATPALTLTFEPDEVRFHPLSAVGNDIAYSFDGINDHGKVFGGAPVNNYIPERVDELKVWVRTILGAPTIGISARTDPR